MMNNNFKTIASAGVGLGLSLVLTDANPAQAAIITYDFSVDIKEGLLTGNTYTGFFSYDDESQPVGFGYGSEEFFLTDFEFNFNGREYTLNDPSVATGGLQAVRRPFFVSGNFNPAIKPTLVVGTETDGAFGSRDWFFGSSVFAPGQNEFQYRQDSPNAYRGDVTYVSRVPVAVPEPEGGVALTLVGLGMFLTTKKIASQKRNPLKTQK